MNAPWNEFSDIPFGSMGWRMGAGEGYLDEFLEWMYLQTEEELDLYFETNKPAVEWESMLAYHRNKMKYVHSPWEPWDQKS